MSTTMSKVIGVDILITGSGSGNLISGFNRSLEDSKKINSTENAENIINMISSVYDYKFFDEEQALLLLWLLNHGQNSTKEIVRKDILANCKDKEFIDKLKRISIPR